MTRKLKYGVGLKDAPSTTKDTWKCPYYSRWNHMLSRCYSEVWRAKYPTYTGVVVCEEWLKFSNFKGWMETQDWEGKQLDKDLLGDGKLYSPNTCCFISGGLNKFLTLSGKTRGLFPVGVSKSDSNFRVQISNPFTKKLDYFGCYKTPEKALEVWKSEKINFAKQLPELEASPILLQKVIEKINAV